MYIYNVVHEHWQIQIKKFFKDQINRKLYYVLGQENSIL